MLHKPSLKLCESAQNILISVAVLQMAAYLSQVITGLTKSELQVYY